MKLFISLQAPNDQKTKGMYTRLNCTIDSWADFKLSIAAFASEWPEMDLKSESAGMKICKKFHNLMSPSQRCMLHNMLLGWLFFFLLLPPLGVDCFFVPVHHQLFPYPFCEADLHRVHWWPKKEEHQNLLVWLQKLKSKFKQAPAESIFKSLKPTWCFATEQGFQTHYDPLHLVEWWHFNYDSSVSGYAHI